jgi:hypothetical protein
MNYDINNLEFMVKCIYNNFDIIDSNDILIMENNPFTIKMSLIFGNKQAICMTYLLLLIMDNEIVHNNKN